MAQVPEDREFFNNPARVILGVGEQMMEGELAYHKGDHAAGFAHLRESVRRCDGLAYSEPLPWMHPPRHALGALLAAQGQFEEAEEVYRTDLGLNDGLQRCAQHPDNVWALHGLVECLQRRGETEELPGLEAKLAAALALTDVEISSACMCRAVCCEG